MSEKIYTRLLRLYPSSFRKEYEGEALQLIRDRLRDETGFFKRARLWWDLLVDVLAGLPSAYRNCYSVAKAAPLSLQAAGAPSFKTLDEEPLGLRPILIGGTIALFSLAVAFAFLLNTPMVHEATPGSKRRISPIESVLQNLNSAPVPDSDASSLQAIPTPPSTQMSGPQGQPSAPGASTPKASAPSTETGVPPKAVNADPRAIAIHSSTPNAFASPSGTGILPMAVNASPRGGVAAIRAGKPDIPRKMSFDVASIRHSKPGKTAPMPNFALDNGDSYTPFPDPGGRFAADFPLPVYIQFAYKLSLTHAQTEAMLARLPKWVGTDSFEIQAKAEGKPTKDQMRLMMQSLLGDRFKLAIHYEKKSTKSPVDVFVVDHVERPSEN